MKHLVHVKLRNLIKYACSTAKLRSLVKKIMLKEAGREGVAILGKTTLGRTTATQHLGRTLGCAGVGVSAFAPSFFPFPQNPGASKKCGKRLTGTSRVARGKLVRPRSIVEESPHESPRETEDLAAACARCSLPKASGAPQEGVRRSRHKMFGYKDTRLGQSI